MREFGYYCGDVVF